MKRSLLYAGLYIIAAAAHSLNPSTQELRSFVALSQRCYASAQATDNQEAFDAFKKINDFYLEHRPAFKDIAQLNREEADTLAGKCSALLTDTLGTVTRSPAPSNLALPDAITVFSRAMPHLLTQRSTSAFLGRLTLLSMIELAFFLIERRISPANQSKGKTMPLITERFKAAQNIPFGSNYFFKMMGLAVGKTVSIGAVNEYTQKGIPSYIHKLAETIIPRVMAIIAGGIMEHNEKGALRKDFWQAATIKIGMPLVLGKAFVSRSHPLYKPLLLLSYILPFFVGDSGKLMLKNGDFSFNAWCNICMDGAASAAIFNGIPAAVDAALPTRDMRLHPAHRRKAIRNAIRGLFDKTFALWNKEAFKTT